MLPTLAAAILLTQSPLAEPLKEGVAYAYPFVIEEDEAPKPKPDAPKKESPTAQTTRVGNVKVTADVENTDFLSQCQAEWDKKCKKREGKEKKKDEKREDHSPKVNLKIEWGTKD